AFALTKLFFSLTRYDLPESARLRANSQRVHRAADKSRERFICVPSKQSLEGWATSPAHLSGIDATIFRKEVIQPQVLLRLPCYDFTPIMSHTLGACLLAVGAATSSTTHFRDVTGGVYKARERIHGVDLIRHY